VEVELEFVKYPKRKKPVRPGNVKRKLLTSSFVVKEDEQEIEKSKQNEYFNKTLLYYKSKKVGKTHPLTPTQQARMHENMQPHDLKNVETITYRMVRLTAQFEELWKTSNKVRWHQSLHAFMVEELNDLANEIVKAQTPKPWPIVFVEEGTK